MSKSRRNQAHVENDQKLQIHKKSWKYIQKYFEKQKINYYTTCLFIAFSKNDYRLEFIVKPVYCRFIS